MRITVFVLNRCFKSMGGGTRGECLGLGRNVGSDCKLKHKIKYGGESLPCPLKDYKQYGNGNLNWMPLCRFLWCKTSSEQLSHGVNVFALGAGSHDQQSERGELRQSEAFFEPLESIPNIIYSNPD